MIFFKEKKSFGRIPRSTFYFFPFSAEQFLPDKQDRYPECSQCEAYN